MENTKRLPAVLLIFTVLLLLSGCTADKRKEKDAPKAPAWEESSRIPWAEEENTVRIVQITDPHFYSLSLTDQGSRYQRVMSNAAGRAALDIGTILDCFVEEMKELKPAVVIVSGDLTLNGEKESHRDFAVYLEQLEQAGIQTLVIPGNSYQYLYLSSWQKACEELSAYPVTEQEKNIMAAFLVRINEDYFSGRMKEKEFYTEQKAYALWKEKAEDSFFTIYMEEILSIKYLDNTWLLLEN